MMLHSSAFHHHRQQQQQQRVLAAELNDISCMLLYSVTTWGLARTPGFYGQRIRNMTEACITP